MVIDSFLPRFLFIFNVITTKTTDSFFFSLTEILIFYAKKHVVEKIEIITAIVTQISAL